MSEWGVQEDTVSDVWSCWKTQEMETQLGLHQGQWCEETAGCWAFSGQKDCVLSWE